MNIVVAFRELRRHNGLLQGDPMSKPGLCYRFFSFNFTSPQNGLTESFCVVLQSKPRKFGSGESIPSQTKAYCQRY
jgi:hypothetical protein